MTLFDEKRKSDDRRCSNDGPPTGTRERRKARNRRQTVIAEITLNEWVKSYLKFQKRMAAKARLEESAKQTENLEDGISDWPKIQVKPSNSAEEEGFSLPPEDLQRPQNSRPPSSGF